jgi:hypothetical protein
VTDLAGKAASSHNHAAGDINSGTLATARLGSGTANSTTYLRGDQTWASVAGGATVTVYEANLGGIGSESWRGRFTIVDAAISGTSKVMIQQAPGPYTNKGTLADEVEMDPIWCVAYPGAGSCVVYWRTMTHLAQDMSEIKGTQPVGSANTQHGQPSYSVPVQRVLGKVRGNVKFQYSVA